MAAATIMKTVVAQAAAAAVAAVAAVATRRIVVAAAEHQDVILPDYRLSVLMLFWNIATANCMRGIGLRNLVVAGLNHLS